MKKFIFMFLLLFTSLNFGATDKELELKVQKLFEKKMEQVKNRTNAQIEKDFSFSKMGTNMYSDKKTYEILSKTYKAIEYSVKSVKVKGNTAEIRIDFKIPNSGTQVIYSLMDLAKGPKLNSYKSMPENILQKTYDTDIKNEILERLNSGNIMYENKKNMKVIVDKVGNWDDMTFDFDIYYGKEFIRNYLSSYHVFKSRIGK